jgi:hypothetical protein
VKVQKNSKCKHEYMADALISAFPYIFVNKIEVILFTWPNNPPLRPWIGTDFQSQTHSTNYRVQTMALLKFHRTPSSQTCQFQCTHIRHACTILSCGNYAVLCHLWSYFYLLLCMHTIRCLFNIDICRCHSFHHWYGWIYFQRQGQANYH